MRSAGKGGAISTTAGGRAGRQAAPLTDALCPRQDLPHDEGEADGAKEGEPHTVAGDKATHSGHQIAEGLHEWGSQEVSGSRREQQQGEVRSQAFWQISS